MYFQIAEPDTKQINKGIHMISWQYLSCLQDNKQTMFTLLFFFVSVDITAYLNGGTVSKGTILTPSTKYGNVHGTDNLSGGQFTFRVPGMYIVMVTIVSNDFQAKFDIYKNSDIIAEGYVAEHPNQNGHDYFHSEQLLQRSSLIPTTKSALELKRPCWSGISRQFLS